MIDALWVFIVSAALFAIGAYGAVIHRNAVRILISLELMFNAELLLLLALASYVNPMNGFILSLFVIALTSSEIGVIVPIIVLLFRRFKSTDVFQASRLRG